MKNLFQILIALFLFGSVGQLSAQESNYVRQPGYWTLGLNGGLAYQSSDICATLDGWGAGATLAKNLYYKPGAPLIFDLRGRLLYDQSYGLDHFRSNGIENNPALQNYLLENGGDGFVFQNNKTHHGELGLEGVISFNRLREKTNINLSLFGGIGLDYYATYTDQKNANGAIYDYTSDDIDLNANRRSITSQLNSQLDARYETEAEGFGDAGQLAVMPAMGLELGYQLTPRFGIGLGHKLTFTKTDLFDGQQWNTDNRITADNDLHHYTNLHLRWIIESEKDKIKPPIIELLTPYTNPFSTSDPLALVKARIKNINSPMDVDYTINGQRTGFDFRKEQFANDFYLNPGRNEVVITATNSAGSDQERVIIYYTEPNVVPPPVVNNVPRPRVNFTNPSRGTEYVISDRYTVTATVLNIDSRRDIHFEVNGRQVTDFSYDPRNDRFTSDIRLTVGDNRLRITASNRAGTTARDDANVILERQQLDKNPPIIEITTPNTDPYHTEKDDTRIRANVYNVENKLDIRFEVNGNYVRSFSFSNNSFSGTANLREGRNTVELIAKNKVGEDRDQIIIYYDTQQPTYAPNVKITNVSQPTSDPYNPDQCKVSIKAEVKHVDSKNDITYLLDGQRFYDFSYNTNTDVLTSVVSINKGKHRVIIKASNQVGTDQDEADLNSCSGTPAGEAPKVEITSPNNGFTTNNPSVDIKALLKGVDRKGDVTLIVNGKRIRKFNYKTSQGLFEANINLKEGTNKITVKANNKDGQDEASVNVNYKVAVVLPTVRITSPRNGTETDKSFVTIKASITGVRNMNDVTLKVNGKNISKFSYRRGSLSATVNLKEGNNKIFVEGRNEAGKADDELTIVYKKVVPPPTVRITSPRNGTETDKSSATIKAAITGVKNMKEVTLKVNGKNISKFSYRNGSLSATVNLKEGNNKIFVEGRNEAGKADDELTIVYKKEVPPPTVRITSPRNGTETDKSSATIKAAITGVKNMKEVTLKVNGKNISKFSYRNGSLSATVNLKEGNNKIFVEGRNEAGKADDELTIVYKKVVPPPTVRITSPRNGTETDKSSATIKASITGVENMKEVTLIVNGKNISKFSFRRGSLSATVNLKEGENKISVAGQNQAGRDSDNISVVYKVKEAPKVPPRINSFSVSQPTVDPLSPNTARSSVDATLSNITKKDQIQFYINNKKTNNFSFNSRTKKLSAIVSLTRGTNYIKIVATNTDGQVDDMKKVVF